MMKLFAYTMINHATGVRTISQMRARDEENVRVLLRQIYGATVEVLNVKLITHGPTGPVV